METFFLFFLIFLMIVALGTGFPVAFALPGAAIIAISLAGITGYLSQAILTLILYKTDRLSGYLLQ